MARSNEFYGYMKAASAQFDGNDGRHLSEAELIAYCRGGMSTPKRTAAQAHLVACAACLALFRDVRDFVEPAHADEPELGALEVNEDWPALWARVQSEAAPMAGANVVHAAAPARGWKALFAWPAGWWQPALACAVLALVVAGLVYFFAKQSVNRSPELVEHTSPTPAPGISPVTPSPVLAQGGSPAPAPNPRQQPPAPPPPPANEEVLAMDLRARPGADFERSATRGEREEVARASLLTARRIYLDVSGAERLRNLLSQQLTQSLSTSGRFALTANRDEAEIALIVAVESTLPAQAEATPARKISFTARIVGADGKTLWPVTPGIIERRYTGPSTKAVAKLSQDLFGELQRLERKR